MKEFAGFAGSALALAVLFTPAALGADTPQPVPSAYKERVTVTGNRLPDDTSLDNVPAHVTVLGREQIDAANASTLQDLLAREAGIMIHDQVGNGLQTTLDMRGLSGGSGTRVFLDGAPINDPRNNALSLELVPLSSLERVEIIRGSAASLAGGGSQAGVIHLTSRRGTEAVSGEFSVSAGSFDATRFGGEFGARKGPIDFFLSASTEDTDGFRANAGGDATRFAATVGTELPKDRRLELTVRGSSVDFGNPGALTTAEIAEDPAQATYNRLDFTDQRAGQVAVNFHGAIAGAWSMAANMFYRDRETESLTTGRAASAFGGFFLDANESAFGSTVQVSHNVSIGAVSNRLTMGLEWLDSDTDAAGFSTPSGALGNIDPANLSSDNTTERRTAALFVQNTWQPTEAWSVMLGVRGDRDRVGYDERFPDSGLDDRKTFSEISLRAGANWNPGERLGFYASYGEAYLPPTVEQMFAFPTFGSNPDLEPEDSESWEVGFRLNGATGPAVDIALFVVDKTNEIIFDPNSSQGPYGANENAGRTRREGLEATVRGKVADDFGFYATLTVVDSEFRRGADRGRAVPLVPEQQVSAGLSVDLAPSLKFSVDGLYVGKQVLDNDAARTQPKLDDYVVFDARLAWKTALASRPGSGLELFVEGKNLFDQAYATRGIYAFDFSTFVNDTFLTPAPGRRYNAGARYTF